MGLSLAERRQVSLKLPPTPPPTRKAPSRTYLEHTEQVALNSPAAASTPDSAVKVPGWKPASIAATIVYMLQIGLFAMHVLEVMFFVGMAGSAVVVVISFIEDAQELFGED